MPPLAWAFGLLPQPRLLASQTKLRYKYPSFHNQKRERIDSENAVYSFQNLGCEV